MFKFLPFVVATRQVLSLKTFAQLEKDLILIAYDSEYPTSILSRAVLAECTAHEKRKKISSIVIFADVAQFIDIEGYIKNGRTHLPVINFKERPDFVGENVM